MAISNKKINRVIIFFIFTIFFILSLITLFYQVDKENKEKINTMKELFEKYETPENVGIISSRISFKNFMKDISTKYYSSDQVIILGDYYYYLTYDGGFIFKYSFYIYKGCFIDDTENLIFSKENLSSMPSFKTLDNKYYISYQKDKKNYIDIYDVSSEEYSNFSNDENKKLDDIVRIEQTNKYNYDVKIVDNESFSIRNIITDYCVIIDEDFIRESSFGYEMSQVDYMPYNIYISNSHIVIIYKIGIDQKYLSLVAYEYIVEEEDLSFIHFRSILLDTKYVLFE